MDKNEFFKIKENEARNKFISRIWNSKTELGMTNAEMTEEINKVLGTDYNESYIRGIAKYITEGYSIAIEDLKKDSGVSDELQELEAKRLEIERERIKIRTEKLELNKFKTSDVRLEMLFENFKESISKIEVPDFNEIEIHKNNKEGLLGISDFHFGKYFISINNKYSEEIFYDRMNRLANETVELCKENGITHLHVLNCGDDVEGMTLRISQLASLQSGFSDQVTKLMKYMVKFLNILSKDLFVTYHHVLCGNHSEIRAFNDKTFTLENMERIIIEYIRDILENNSRVNVPVYGGKYVDFDILGYNVYAQHGQKVKNPKNVIANVSQQLRKFIDVAYFGHLHHEEQMTTNEAPTHDCEVVYIPSIMGSDEYSDDNFFGGAKASAKLDIYEQGKCRKGSFKIVLN